MCFTPPTGTPYTFLYDGTQSTACTSSSTLPGYNDTVGAGELTKVIFPWGGHLRWTYFSDPYSGSRDLRAVGGRYLAADYLGATEWSYGITWDNAANAVTHGTMTLADASGIGAKTWNFTNSGSTAWQIGLASLFVQSASQNGTVLQSDAYTWSQDPASNPYISAKTTTINPGSSQQTALSTQTLDQYGNVTHLAIYPYGNTTTPVKAYTNTYMNSSMYTSNYIFNLSSSTTLSPSGGTGITLVSNSFDAYLWVSPSNGTPTLVDPNAIPLGQRGYLSYSGTPAGTTTATFWTYGAPNSVTGPTGTTVTMNADPTTNYAAPTAITNLNYNTTVAYNSWLGVTSTAGSNGEQLSMTYDSYGRPSTATSPYGAVTTYTYSTALPMTQTKTGSDGVTVTTLDGLGRAILVSRGDTSGVHSYAGTVYAPCACSPWPRSSRFPSHMLPEHRPIRLRGRRTRTTVWAGRSPFSSRTGRAKRRIRTRGTRPP